MTTPCGEATQVRYLAGLAMSPFKSIQLAAALSVAFTAAAAQAQGWRTSGPKFHVAKVDADGGPLLTGRDLSSYFSLKSGDVAAPNAFGKLIGGLRSTYWRAGYADSLSTMPRHSIRLTRWRRITLR